MCFPRDVHSTSKSKPDASCSIPSRARAGSGTDFATRAQVRGPDAKVHALQKSIEVKLSRDTFETVKHAEEVQQASTWIRSRSRVKVPGAARGEVGSDLVEWSSDECRQGAVAAAGDHSSVARCG